MFFQKYKKIIILIVLLIAAPVTYSLIRKDSVSEEALLVSTNTNAQNQAQIAGSEIISALNQIQTLNLSKDIFEDEVFRSLKDRSEPIPLEDVGKTNPFSPIGRDNVPTTRATTTPTSNNTIINTTNNRPTTNQPVI